MKTRAKSAFIMAPLLVFVFLGGHILALGMAALTILALHEYTKAFGEKRPSLRVQAASAVILYICYCFFSFWQHFFIVLFLWLFVSLLLCFISMFAVEKRDLMQGMASVTGVVYIIFLGFHIVLIDVMFSVPFFEAGILRVTGLQSYVWIVFLSAFGADIFAYFTGRLIGKHKLCPSISPNKTVEGAVGGFFGSVALCGLFGYFFLPGGFVVCIIIGAVCGVVSQLGDLSASVLKRKIGIKDWGTLIPGHGGVLDRIDSVLFTAPAVFYILFFWSIAGI